MCDVCKVPLCTKLLLNQTETCFQKWHRCDDLAAAHEEQKEGLRSQREHSKGTGKYEQARNVSRNLMEQEEFGDIEADAEDAMIEQEIERQNNDVTANTLTADAEDATEDAMVEDNSDTAAFGFC